MSVKTYFTFPLKFGYFLLLSCLSNIYFYFKISSKISFKKSIRNSISESNKKIQKNQTFPKNLTCIDLSTKSLVLLKTKTNTKNRPLVINFGSLTSEKFINTLPEWRQLTAQFNHTVDFLMVYTKEGQTCEESSRYFKYGEISETSIFERIAKAEKLVEKERPSCSVFVDNMNNTGCFLY